jgi:hypothetical protein
VDGLSLGLVFVTFQAFGGVCVGLKRYRVDSRHASDRRECEHQEKDDFGKEERITSAFTEVLCPPAQTLARREKSHTASTKDCFCTAVALLREVIAIHNIRVTH